MQGGFDEEDLFRAIFQSGARVMLIGRRALVALGLPVLTADYDVWVHFDDVEVLNKAMADVDHHPTCAADEARRRGRYAFENDEHVDVMIARSATTKLGTTLSFDEAWSRRETIRVGSVDVAVPAIQDLIRTKEWSLREKDVRDIELLEGLRQMREKKP